MNKEEKKKIFWSILESVLKPQGFKFYKTGMDPAFNKYISDNIVIGSFLNFQDSGDLFGGALDLTNYEVEDFILDLDLHVGDLSSYREKKKYHLSTIVDHSKHKCILALYDGSSIKYNPDNIYRVETPEAVTQHAHAILHYLEKEGAEFVEKYSYLPNILKEMDRVQSEGKYWNEVLSGMGDLYFRGLIISKLCNDPNYEEKLKMVDDLFANYDEWHVHWEKLKSILPSIDPKYPYYK
jgi:hypothetical protein